MPKGKKGFQKGHKDFRTAQGIQQMARKISLVSKGKPKPNLTGDKHPNWKGDDVSYPALHGWVRRKLGKPNECVECGVTNAKRYEWANISGKYKRDLKDWKRLCASCHRIMDLKTTGKSSGYKTHCPKGHEYNEENTARHGTTGFVYCRACNRLRAKRYLSNKVMVNK